MKKAVLVLVAVTAILVAVALVGVFRGENGGAVTPTPTSTPTVAPTPTPGQNGPLTVQEFIDNMDNYSPGTIVEVSGILSKYAPHWGMPWVYFYLGPSNQGLYVIAAVYRNTHDQDEFLAARAGEQITISGKYERGLQTVSGKSGPMLTYSELVD